MEIPAAPSNVAERRLYPLKFVTGGSPPRFSSNLWNTGDIIYPNPDSALHGAQPFCGELMKLLGCARLIAKRVRNTEVRSCYPDSKIPVE